MNRFVPMVLRHFPTFFQLYCKLCRYARHPERYGEQEKWDAVHNIMSVALSGSNVDLTVTGADYIPAEGGFMLYGNHQGLFDVVAIAATIKRPMAVVYKKEVSNVPLLKQIYACTNSFAIDREDVRQSLQVIQSVTKEVQGGKGYLIFPEGTRSRKGNEMLPFHGGSFRCAIKAKCPIVPVAFIDSFKALDEKGSKRVAVQMHYLEPIPYEEFAGMKTVEVAEMVRSRIAQCLEENIK